MWLKTLWHSSAETVNHSFACNAALCAPPDAVGRGTDAQTVPGQSPSETNRDQASLAETDLPEIWSPVMCGLGSGLKSA